MNRDLTKKETKPRLEDYATIESMIDGVPVWSFGNLCFIYGVSPDFTINELMQAGNQNPSIKIKPKKSWEIKNNLCGSEHEMTVRTKENDVQPLLHIHLIDGDPETIWSSWGCPVPDGRQEWIRIDLPQEEIITSVSLKCAPKVIWKDFGRALPKELEIDISRDAWHWEKVYENKNVDETQSSVSVKFEPRAAKQIWIKANNFPKKNSWAGYIFSIASVEIGNAQGENLALVSRGASVMVSSTNYMMHNDRLAQDALWGPLQYDLGNKWVRLGTDNGSLTWRFVEKEKGKFEIDPKTDASITECVRNGIKVIMVLDFKGNWLYADPPRKTDWTVARYREFNDNYNDCYYDTAGNPEMLKGYLRYVEFMTRYFKDRVAIFEICNEWNHLPWDIDAVPNSPEKYIKKYFSPALEIIKRVAPDAKIMLGNILVGRLHTLNLILDCLNMPEGVASKVDGIGWHPCPEPDTEYFDKVREIQKMCRDKGFTGDFYATEIYSESTYPPGKPSEIEKAKKYIRSLVGHNGLDMSAGPCHPAFTAYPQAVSLCQTTWPCQTVTPCYPSISYYMWRTACTVMDDFHVTDFPVKLATDRKILHFAFKRGSNEFMSAVWLDEVFQKDPVSVKTDMLLAGKKVQQAWIVDALNGREQELVFAVKGRDTEIKGIMLKDYPVFIRVLVHT